jgi:hypothetical protein
MPARFLTLVLLLSCLPAYAQTPGGPRFGSNLGFRLNSRSFVNAFFQYSADRKQVSSNIPVQHILTTR